MRIALKMSARLVMVDSDSAKPQHVNPVKFQTAINVKFQRTNAKSVKMATVRVQTSTIPIKQVASSALKGV